ncbi:hypothetical protein GCM10010271_72930 [Streptomyces kurssanovii]|nr:hypothetical protein GCM10010271_72930 [Streptomyces kurssanovii]
MASPLPPRLTPCERARHRTHLVISGTLFGLTCLGMLGFAVLVVVGNLAWDDSGSEVAAKSSPSPAGSHPIRWLYDSSTCRDGWDSPSIGQRGACSQHGGVVSVYKSSPGGLYTRCDDAEFRPRTLERAEELADTDGWVGCTVYPYGTASPAPSRG